MALVQFWPPTPNHGFRRGNKVLDPGDTFEVSDEKELAEVLAEPEFRRAPAQRKEAKQVDNDESQSPDGTEQLESKT